MKDYGPGNHTSGVFHFAMLALGTLFFVEAARELIGTVYNFNLSNMELGPSVAVLLAFFGPTLSVPRWKLSPDALLSISVISIALARVALSLDLPAVLYMVPAGIIVLMSGVFMTAFLSRPRFPVDGVPSAGLAVALGVSMDVAARSAGGSYDVLIYWFNGNRMASLFAVVPLVALFTLSLAAPERHKEVDEGGGWVNPLYGWGSAGFSSST